MDETALIFFLIFITLFLFSYVFMFLIRGMGLYRMAKNIGLEQTAIYAFIPIANIYLLGELVNGSVNGEYKYEGAVGLGLYLCNMVFGGFLTLFYTFYYYLMGHKLFEKLGTNATLHTVVNVLTFGTWFYFAVFIFRNKIFKKDIELTKYVKETDGKYEDGIIDLTK